MSELVIIDYGAGNIRSVVNACRAVGATPEVIADGRTLAGASPARIIMPGVGAVGSAIDSLNSRGLAEALHDHVFTRSVPFLGICVGMQVLATRCEEFGDHRGLGWVPGRVARIAPEGAGIRVPHVGWNTVVSSAGGRDDSPLSAVDGEHFYFQHSYAFDCDDDGMVLAVSDYGGPFASAVRRDNILGVQFHPEKSGRAGRAVLTAFLALA